MEYEKVLEVLAEVRKQYAKAFATDIQIWKDRIAKNAPEELEERLKQIVADETLLMFFCFQIALICHTFEPEKAQNVYAASITKIKDLMDQMAAHDQKEKDEDRS